MSTSYSVQIGDTFEIIARKVYGIDSKSSIIQKANPGAQEPLTAGTSLIIPPLQDAVKNKPQRGKANNPDEVALLIDGKRFRFWEAIRITRNLDSMASVEFLAPFESGLKEFRETFRPLTFKSMEVTIGGERLFNGTMLTPTPSIEENRTAVEVVGYSLPGVLNDCTPSPVDSTLEFNNQGLNDIAKNIALPFGLGVKFDADQGAIFERVACKTGKKALTFLIELAKQRNLIISDDENGKLKFIQSIDTGKPVAVLKQGASPVLSVSPQFQAQNYYSHITGLEPVATGLNGSKYTVKNPKLNNVIRPTSFRANDTKNADLKTATEARIGRMFGNIVEYRVNVSTWRDPNGDLWAENTTVKLKAPDAMIYKSYEFLIRSVIFESNENDNTATLVLVLPDSFRGKVPEVLPWDE